MRLKSFAVAGFKNLKETVKLSPLQPVNVLHGANNAGKTNVLQAMDVMFRLLRTGSQVTKDQKATLDKIDEQIGYSLDEIINRESRSSIRFWLELSIDAEDLEDAGLEANYPTDHVAIGLELAPGLGNAMVTVIQFALGDTDVLTKDPARDPALVGFAQQIRSLIGRTYSLELEQMGSPFRLLDCGLRGAGEGGLIPLSLRDALFDARMSLDRERRQRWTLFVDLAKELEPELGPGQFDTAFDRASGQAGLIYDTGTTAIPVERFGAGIQRFIGLVGSLVLSPAAFVAIEEPELFLSYNLQQRLQWVLEAIAEHGGPKQFFLSSHSTALDGADNVFVVEAKDGVPTVEQRAWEDGAPAQNSAGGLRVSGAEGNGKAQHAAAPSPSDTRSPAPETRPAGEAPAPPDLDSLIGLVDQLSELDPEEIVAKGGGPDEGGKAGEKNGAAKDAASQAPGAGRTTVRLVETGPRANGERTVDAAPWRAPARK